MQRRVIIESPYKGESDKIIERNVHYARACIRDCFLRGEAPFASHLLYTQDGILDDTIAEEREQGIEAGLLWGEVADATIVYIDHGVSDGMAKGICRAEKDGRPVEYRRLYPND